MPEHCLYRITKETIQFGMGRVVPLDQVPGEGICSLSPGGNIACPFPGFNADNCPRQISQHLVYQGKVLSLRP